MTPLSSFILRFFKCNGTLKFAHSGVREYVPQAYRDSNFNLHLNYSVDLT